MTNGPTQNLSAKQQVNVLFIRCLDCDKYHDLTCDIALVSETRMSSADFQRFAKFLLEQDGHRLATKAQTVQEKIL